MLSMRAGSGGLFLSAACVASYVLGTLLIHARFGPAPAPTIEHHAIFPRKAGEVVPPPPLKKREELEVTASPQGSMGCGVDADLIVGVLSAPGQRSAESRQAIRETWMKLPTKGYRTTMKFLLALDEVCARIFAHLDDYFWHAHC